MIMNSAMKNFVDENERVLEKWEQEYINRGYDVYFTPDGIMYRGNIKWDGKNWRHLPSEKDNELWANAPLRILFLTKDQNGGENHDDCWDVRADAYHRPDSEVEENLLYKQYAFNNNIVKVLYGLVTTTPQSMIGYMDIDEREAVRISDVFPFARINCKKETGGPSCPDGVLANALAEFSSFLEEQIHLLDADIFICCGSGDYENKILNFLNEHGYNFKYLNDDCYSIYYDEEKNKIAIDSYHLSNFTISRQSIYEDIVVPYYKFLQAHPEFINSHRK